MAVCERQQRYQGRTREVHLADDLSRLVEHIAEHQLDRLENRQQASRGRARKRCEQAVFDHFFGLILNSRLGTGHVHVCAATYLSRN
jgi:hypothetical protein